MKVALQLICAAVLAVGCGGGALSEDDVEAHVTDGPVTGATCVEDPEVERTFRCDAEVESYRVTFSVVTDDDGERMVVDDCDATGRVAPWYGDPCDKVE